MTRSILVVLALTGCSVSNWNRATLAVSTFALACDWGQTRSAAVSGWKDRREENPFMGGAPSVWAVDAYFVSALVLNAAIWIVMPRAIKGVIPWAVAGAQANSVVGNFDTTVGVCGL